MLNKFILSLIVFFLICTSAFSQDMPDERLEARKFIDGFFWYRKYLPLDSISELYTLRNMLAFLEENDAADFENPNVILNMRIIHDLNNKVLEKLKQRMIQTEIKLDILIKEHESNDEVQEAAVQYTDFITVIANKNYPHDDACLDKIDGLFSRLITGLGYIKLNAGNRGVIYDESTGLGDGKASSGISVNEGIYTVKKGDYLRKIAAILYGNERYWRHIYNHNRDQGLFGANPDLIHPGVTIEIPKLPEKQ